MSAKQAEIKVQKEGRKVRGSVFASGHEAFTRGLLQDTDVRVSSKGSMFYNANQFITVYFMSELGKYLEENEGLTKLERSDLVKIQTGINKVMKDTNEIVIAATPDWVDAKYMDLLDGGILHECAHSLYTERNTRMDLERLTQMMADHFKPEVNYAQRIPLLKKLANIYEDAFIEIRIIEKFRGALHKLQAVHEFVWDLEKIPRNIPVGAQVPHPETQKPMKGFKGIDHFTCALRDLIEHHLINAPLNEYHPSVMQILQSDFADLIEASNHTQDSYDCVELAFRTLNRLAEDFSEEESQSSQGEGEGEEGEGGEGESSNGPGSKEGGSGGKKAQGEGEGEGNPNQNSGDETKSEGSGDGDEDSEDESKSKAESTKDKDSPHNDKDEKEVQEIKRSMLEDGDAESMEDTSSALKKYWDDQVSSDAPRTILPYTREHDKIFHIQPDNTPEESEVYKEMMDECRTLTLAIRPRMLSFFRAKDKTRRKHRQESGKRFGRTIAEICYKDKPKPYQNRVVKRSKNSSVYLILDESGSMSSHRHEARMILSSLALTIGQLKIPHEIMGFTTSGGRSYNSISDDDYKTFTRFNPTKFRIFRTFDEPYNVNSYRKLTHTSCDNLTPLPDAMEYAGQRLMTRSEEQKIMFVVTDGYPYYGNTRWSSEDYLQIMQRQVDDFKRMNIEMLFVGIGGDAEFINRFPNSVIIKNMDTFTQQFNSFLFQQMKRLLA
jgi:cobalamin biosynthesis protein CobT